MGEKSEKSIPQGALQESHTGSSNDYKPYGLSGIVYATV